MLNLINRIFQNYILNKKIAKQKEFLGNIFYFLPDTWIYKKLKKLPIIKTDINYAQKILEKNLNCGTPKLIARIGGNELDFMYNYSLLGKGISKHLLNELKVTAGVFDIESDETKNYLSHQYKIAMSNIDVLVSWRKEERYFNFNNSSVINLTDLEIFRAKFPFTRSLTGNILIINPFIDSIKYQVNCAEKNNEGTAFKLFNFSKVQFIYFKPLQTHGFSNKKEINNWSTALEYQKKQIAKLDFDVALISCGAYGLPLGNFIKSELNKNAVVVGGVLQLYFDIIGRRWENNRRVMNSLHKKSIIRPSISEKPINHTEIESSAYF